jgi:hypothetical protein
VRRGCLLIALLVALMAGSAGNAAAAGEYGFVPGVFAASQSTSLAGGHPDLTVGFELEREPSGEPVATTGTIKIALPPGLTGNPNAVTRCTEVQLLTTDVNSPTAGSCPPDSQVGITEVTLYNAGGVQSLIEPVFNMEAPGDGDVVARLGFYAKFFPTVANIRVRSDSDYGLTASLEGVGSFIPLLSATTTIWGVPAAAVHDPLRITPYEAIACGGNPCTSPGEEPRKSGLNPAPFLSNATNCMGPQELGLTAVSYADPQLFDTEVLHLPELTGCAKLGFSPTLRVSPTSRQAAAPTGLDAELSLPQDESVGGRATAQLRGATVSLPRGMTLAAGAADGLAACSAREAGFASTAAARCPESAKLGAAEIDVPALSHPITASVYQRTPEPGHLFRIWLVADELGLHLALPGEIHLDPSSGQITSVFVDTPPAPVRRLELHLKSGPRAPLANPRSCGTYLTHYEFAPWSGTGVVVGDSPLTIDQGCDTGNFGPKLVAGSVDPAAGAFSPFVATLTRDSGEQNISLLNVRLPKGVLAKLAGVGVCDEPAALSGNCPAGSQVGKVKVATGPGSSPLWIPQPGKSPTAAYLAGPYHGAPYSLVVKVPAQAGPFDLGTVITRVALRVDPETTQVTAVSDPLPQFLEGVPVDYRTIHMGIDRSRFIVNPTSCARASVVATLTSSEGRIASAPSRFQAADCDALGFTPRLALRLKGGTKRAAHPALRAVLSPARGDENIAFARVALPHSEFLDNAHIRTICTRVQFAADACPRAAAYGHATAFSPLLDRPLSGPVYLRSSNHQLPDLVADLRGQIQVVVAGQIDSVNGGIRTTFRTVPDAPVSKFVLTMSGGKKGLLENSIDLCAARPHANVRFRGQNGKEVSLHPRLKSNCGGSRPASGKHSKVH